jgi:hypothetical protein
MRNGNKQKSVAGRLGQARRQSGLPNGKTQAVGSQGQRRGRPLGKRGASRTVKNSLAGPYYQNPLVLEDSAPIKSILQKISEHAAAGEAWEKIQPLVEQTIDQAHSEDLDTQLRVYATGWQRSRRHGSRITGQ